MDVKTIIAAAPVVRRAWKFTPPALRVPLLVIGAGVVAWNYLRGEGAAPAE
jgi:hypothetical protein